MRWKLLCASKHRYRKYYMSPPGDKGESDKDQQNNNKNTTQVLEKG
jgi:hypothetical protein